MAYDDVLAGRIRDRLRTADGVVEKRMFGGLGFLTFGNLTVAVRGDDLLVRVDPADTDAALARPGVTRFGSSGRSMRGWVVAAGQTLDDSTLDGWIKQAQQYVAGLPP